MPDVVMPRLSDSMEEGTILKWLVAPGADVKRGQELVEIETDKATMTYEADADGALEIVAAEGDTLPIGTLIARIGGDSDPSGNGAAEGVDGASAEGASGASAEGAEPVDSAPRPQQGPPPVAAARSVPATGAVAPPAPPTGSAAPARTRASPLARRLAREQGVDVAGLHGTGPGGRVVKADVEAAKGAPATETPPAETPAPLAPSGSPAPVPSPGAAQTGTAKGTVTSQDLTRTQQLVARRMAESKATVPEFTLTTEIDMERAVALRAEIKALDDEAPAPSYNDMVVKACGLALREFPRANGAYRDGRFELYSRVNVGVAVAVQDALVVPTVFDADARGLGEVAAATRALAERVRSNEITPPELSGGTFTVSNLGMYGVTMFTAVINPPQAAILAVGAMTPRAVASDGQVVVRNVMPVTLACDHRILYGADAAQFLARIRELLEHPLALLV